MYELRDYQEEAVDKGYNSLRGGKNEIIVAPGGSGKSLIIAGLCKKLDDNVLILQPTKEILEQNYEKLLSYGITDIGIYSASMKRKDIGKYTYATIGSIFRNPELFTRFNYILTDEAHLINPKSFTGNKSMYSKFFTAIGNPRVLGLTASPYRLVMGYHKEEGDLIYTTKLQILNRIHPFFFKSFAYNITNKTLSEKGYLCPLEYLTDNKYEIDLTEIPVNSTGAEFKEEILNKYLELPRNITKITDAIISNKGKYNHNLVSASSINQAYKISEVLNNLGYKSSVITGIHSKEERETLIADFRSGLIQDLINVNVLSVGFDFPELDMITLGSPTLSLGLYYQRVSRGVRKDPNNPNKICKILDVSGNVKRFGRIEYIRVGREPNGFRNVVYTEKGIVSGIPLASYIVKNKAKKNIILKQ